MKYDFVKLWIFHLKLFEGRSIIYIGQPLSYRLQVFVSYWLLNKYIRVFISCLSMMRVWFQLVIKLDSIEEFRAQYDYSTSILFKCIGMFIIVVNFVNIEYLGCL